MINEDHPILLPQLDLTLDIEDRVTFWIITFGENNFPLTGQRSQLGHGDDRKKDLEWRGREGGSNDRSGINNSPAIREITGKSRTRV
jgi:hypothetical protein